MTVSSRLCQLSQEQPPQGGGGHVMVTGVSTRLRESFLGTFAPTSRRWCFGFKIKPLQESIWYLVKQNKPSFPGSACQPLTLKLNQNLGCGSKETWMTSYWLRRQEVWGRISFRVRDFILTLLFPAVGPCKSTSPPELRSSVEWGSPYLPQWLWEG